MDNAQLVEWLQALEVAQVTVTATIDPSGRLGSVGGLWPKLLAATREAAQLGLLRVVVVSAEQSDVAAELLAPDASPLRVVKAATLQEAIEKLYEEHGPREAVRRSERKHCARIDLLGRSVPLERHYQILPLLRAVKRERLLHHPRSLVREENPEFQLRPIDILRWEEELREERVTYERVSLEQIFNDFPSAVKEAKTTMPRFAVLGPPGSGKTTLTQYLGWQAANGSLRVSGRPLLPARVRLRDWEAWTAQEGEREQRLPQYLAEQYKDLPGAPSAEQWRRWLQKGEVLLLLDGLDEIEGKPAFLAVLKAALRAFSECPLVITCRTVSFEQHRAVCPDFPLFTLAGLEPDKRDAYIRAFPTEHPDHYDPNKLIDQLKRTPQMLPLAANPLLLNIICYVVDDAPGVFLPATRGGLYQKALEKLLTYRLQRVEVRYPGAAPDTHEKLMILQRTALNLFAHGDRRLTFTGQDLAQALKQALSAEGYGDTPAPWANALRTDLMHNSGILRGSAEHGSFFLHLTVQEFLAAVAIARLVNEKGWEARVEIGGTQVSARQLVDRKAWDPRWHEVITLLAGQLTDPAPLLTSLADEKKDDFFGHRLALAALCLPEVQPALGKKLSVIADHLTTATFARWLRYETHNTATAVPHLTRALPALAQVNGRIAAVPFLQWLCLRLHDTNANVRSAIAEALGHIGESVAQYSDVLSALVAALHDRDVLVRAKAAETLRRVGEAAAQHPAVLTALAQAALHDEDWFVRFGATRALERMGTAATEHPEARLVLLKARDDEQRRGNSPAADTLMQKADPDPLRLEALPALVAALHEQDEGVRVKAAEAIKQSGEASLQHPHVLPTLIEITLHDSDGGVRARAVDALGQIGALVPQHPEVLLALVAALHDKDEGVRSQAARALGQIGKTGADHPDVLPALLEALRDQDSYVSAEAAEALGQLMAQGVRVFRRWWGKMEGRMVEQLASLHE
jgi:HEAT repeat protein